jgi:eukaryotic-like serine/threonine-protein kinase
VIGTALGPYRLLGKLGEGGMGEVYRAHDSKLDRDVAIKVLPTALAADPDARVRFEREAKAVAALSHPNILAIHDFGLEGAVAYAVTELLDGATLRDRLRQGALPFRKAVAIARDIALGLAAAHAKGLVHRDIKPENVFLTAGGHVKILDFGIARQIAALSDSRTESGTTLSTSPGTVLGTIGYMSPEQVRGQIADHRADLFSLGCVLFEMIGGRRAFERPTAAETMTAILREDPPDLAAAGGAVTPGLDHVIRHCLEKQPDERFQSARDLAFALQALSGGSTASGPSAVVPLPTSMTRRWPVALAVGTLVIGIAGGRWAWSGGTPPRPSLPVSFQQISDSPGVETEPSLSPDGKSIVYTQLADGSSDIYLLRVGSRSPILLTPHSPVEDDQPAFSPDGERIAFRSERDGGGIFLMSTTGESVKRLTDFGFNPSWSPDGTELVLAMGRFLSPTDRGSFADGLWVVNVATGEKRQVLKDTDAMQPSWSPHRTRIAFWGLRAQGGQRDIFTVAADGSEREQPARAVTNDLAVDWSPAWSPDGAHLYFSSRRGGTMNLWRIGVDEASGRTLGEPEPVTTPSIWSGFFSFSRDGSRMAFASVNWRSTLLRATFDPAGETLTGAPTPMLRGTRSIRDHAVSPDGEWVAFSESGEHEDIFVARVDGSEYRRLTDDGFRDRGTVWFPDGRGLAFYSDRSGSYEVWTIRPDGSGLQRLTDSVGGMNFPTFSPDGTRLSTWSVTGPWWQIVDATHGATRPAAESLPQIDGRTAFWPMSWSPDGRRLLGLGSHRDGTAAGLAIYDMAGRRFTTLPSESSVWSSPIWLPDSQRFLMRNARGIWLLNPARNARKLLVPVGGYLVGRSIGVSQDGRVITYTETGTEGEVWLATMPR